MYARVLDAYASIRVLMAVKSLASLPAASFRSSGMQGM
jgi:hypothetical protein